MRHITAQAEAQQPTPEFFRPPPPPLPQPQAQTRAALTSAPVSREVPSGNRIPSIPSRINLSAEERQIAAASGISDKQYAENKIRMMRMKQTGEIQQ